MSIKLPYGSRYISLPSGLEVDEEVVINPRYLPRIGNLEDVLKESLENPIGSESLSDIIRKGNKVAILFDDITRPGPKREVGKFLLEYLLNHGVKESNITIIFATGLHRKHTRDEWKCMLGEDIVNRFRIIDHDADREHRYFGETSRGTPVEIDEIVANADITIGVSYLAIHDFAGYTGGAKIILPGVASRRAVQTNHILSLDKRSRPGVADGNPTREDMEEAAKLFGYDFSINIPLNYKKEPTGIFAGDFIKAHREGIKQVDFMYKVGIGKKVDVIIASPGGFPYDINLYQASRVLVHCDDIIAEGGTLVLVGEFREGIGDRDTEAMLRNYQNADEAIEVLRRDYTIGKWVGWKFLRAVEKYDFIIVSDTTFEKGLFERVKIKVLRSIDEALKLIHEKHGKSFDYLVIPYGCMTLPTS